MKSHEKFQKKLSFSFSLKNITWAEAYIQRCKFFNFRPLCLVHLGTIHFGHTLNAFHSFYYFRLHFFLVPFFFNLVNTTENYRWNKKWIFWLFSRQRQCTYDDYVRCAEPSGSSEEVDARQQRHLSFLLSWHAARRKGLSLNTKIFTASCIMKW